MANLTFYYGTMECGKTTKLLQDHFNYTKHKLRTLVIKPGIDTKGGTRIVNRQGEDLEVDLVVFPDTSLLNENILNMLKDIRFILADEAQFFTKNQARELWYIAHFSDINVVTYGLKSNFKGEPFEGTQELFAKADIKYELSVNCMCGKPAVFNARRVNGVFVAEGEEVVIDGEHSHIEYVPCCSECYLNLVVMQEHPELKLVRKRLQNLN